MSWKTINKEKLEKEIDARGMALDAIRRGRHATRNTDEAIRYNTLTAEHNALMVILNCLDD